MPSRNWVQVSFPSGSQPGTHVAILAENNPRWLITDLAILGCAGVDVPVGTRITDKELEFVISHADCDIAVVEDATTLQRLLSLRRKLPRLRKVMVMDFAGPKPNAGTGEERVMIYTWEEVLKKGRTRIARGERQFELRGASVTPADTATLLYTSGTTGRPKGVMLSHGSVMHNVTSVHASINPAPGATWLSVLPVWHAFERTVEYCSLSFGSTIAYSRLSDWKIFDDMRAVRRVPRDRARAAGEHGEEHREKGQLPGRPLHPVREVLPGLLQLHHGPLPALPQGGATAGVPRGGAAAPAPVPGEAGLPLRPSPHDEGHGLGN